MIGLTTKEPCAAVIIYYLWGQVKAHATLLESKHISRRRLLALEWISKFHSSMITLCPSQLFSGSGGSLWGGSGGTELLIQAKRMTSGDSSGVVWCLWWLKAFLHCGGELRLSYMKAVSCYMSVIVLNLCSWQQIHKFEAVSITQINSLMCRVIERLIRVEREHVLKLQLVVNECHHQSEHKQINLEVLLKWVGNIYVYYTIQGLGVEFRISFI